jgi:peptide/nickel transport system substrate-binding protein
MTGNKFSRRDFLRIGGLTAAGAALAGCKTVVTQTVEVPVEQTVEVPVQSTVVVQATQVIESQLPVEVPRQSVFVTDQIYRYPNPDNFNFWAPGGGQTPTNHALLLDTLWYTDQETGEAINALAKEPPIYNDDFTEMTVHLREGIYWSDGVEFTADDYVFTCNLLKDHPGMAWSTELGLYMEDVTAPDPYTLVFTLKEPNPRFHYFFKARWSGVYAMAKHVWETVEDPMTFTNNPPVSLSAYVYEQLDPAGYWLLYKRRDDWERTAVGMIIGKPGPEYVLTIFYGGSERNVIAMARHELDVLMDLDYEAFNALIAAVPTVRSWFPDFPWVFPDESDARWIGFNYESLEWPRNKDVRWALALALDMFTLETEYIGGVNRITPIPQPATAAQMQWFHVPLEPWLKELTLDIGNGETFKPYDETVPQRVAAWATDQGHTVPTDAEGIRMRFGMGWWKHAPDVAEKLLLKNGFSKNADGMWLLPDGTPWKITINVCPDEVDSYRLAIGMQDQWGQFGIQVEAPAVERQPFYDANSYGTFEVTSTWDGGAGVDCDATSDKWQSIRGLHSQFYAPVGTSTNTVGSTNIMRLKDPEIDSIIDELGALYPDDPQVLELGRDFMKLWVENMYGITMMSFKKFITFDTTYWKGFPTSENPTYQPLYWFQGGKFAFQSVEPQG